MANPPSPDAPSDSVVPRIEPPVLADEWSAQLGTLLGQLESMADAGRALPAVVSPAADSQLIEVRLGVASSLFAALQCKHAATAGHSLRVALTCSAWALRMGLGGPQRDAVELAALLHDVGLIGAPDNILLKPGQLEPDEAEIVARSRKMSLEILRHSCDSPEVLDIVEYVAAWYDGTRKGFAKHGERIPLGARMIAIAEAFDAMTTDHVYRPAMSHERAMGELFDCAGTQFDPELVRQFAEFHGGDAEVHHEVAGRWLNSLDPELVNSYWHLNCVPSPGARPDVDVLFQSRLLENMYDAAVFVDAGQRVILWNRGAERLTGIASTSILGRQWAPELVGMCDERGHAVADTDCPVAAAMHSGVQSLRRLTIWGRTGRSVAVDSHAIPVISDEGMMHGTVLLLHDASSETSLEQRCQNLYEKATKDSLTQVANRAEFDRVHEMFLAAHQRQRVPCSLIICDLDRFKQVNDTYGHQAGDEVIKSLATLLKNSCRPGDLVARYGGEEFVVLCADCDNASAARRAEQVRKALSKVPQPRMDGRAITASFGVTQVQPGDTPATMLRRADRALLLAKGRGRNCVVQLGSGSGAEDTDARGGLWQRKPAGPCEVVQQNLVTPVPVNIAIEKLRGFVADHQAKVVRVDGNRMLLEIDNKHPSTLKRKTDRPVTFSLELQFEENHGKPARERAPTGSVTKTRVRVTISPCKTRDRRRGDVQDRAREVLASLRSYLMANEEEPDQPGGAWSRARRLLAPWLRPPQP